MTKQDITIISGATATGKTTYALNYAAKLMSQGDKVVIINFDSLLFYRELNIGTAKPSKHEQETIPHEMIDICSATTPINAYDYCVETLKLVDQYHNKNYNILLVGGSGFYIRALVKGMYNSPPISDLTHTTVEQIMQDKGIDQVRLMLQKFDLESFNSLHPNDHYRNIRALEHWLEHQTPLSQQKKEFAAQEPYNFALNKHGWHVNHHYLVVEKEQHWDIIKQRTKQMISAGLIDEVDNLLKNGFSGIEKPLQSIGYKETIDYLNGKITTSDELIEKIYIATRRLAKSQKTFFKKIMPLDIIEKEIN